MTETNISPKKVFTTFQFQRWRGNIYIWLIIECFRKHRRHLIPWVSWYRWRFCGTFCLLPAVLAKSFPSAISLWWLQAKRRWNTTTSRDPPTIRSGKHTNMIKRQRQRQRQTKTTKTIKNNKDINKNTNASRDPHHPQWKHTSMMQRKKRNIGDTKRHLTEQDSHLHINVYHTNIFGTTVWWPHMKTK